MQIVIKISNEFYGYDLTANSWSDTQNNEFSAKACLDRYLFGFSNLSESIPDFIRSNPEKVTAVSMDHETWHPLSHYPELFI